MAHLASRACDVSPVPGPPRRLPAATIVEPAALDVKPRPPMAMRLGVVRVDSTAAGVGNTASSDGAGTRPRLPDGSVARKCRQMLTSHPGEWERAVVRSLEGVPAGAR